jgi:hypothetical protein
MSDYTSIDTANYYKETDGYKDSLYALCEERKEIDNKINKKISEARLTIDAINEKIIKAKLVNDALYLERMRDNIIDYVNSSAPWASIKRGQHHD